MEAGTLLIISAPHYVAGLIYKERAAPIIQYMIDWDIEKIRAYCAKKNWKVMTLEEALENERRYDTGS